MLRSTGSFRLFFSSLSLRHFTWMRYVPDWVVGFFRLFLSLLFLARRLSLRRLIATSDPLLALIHFIHRFVDASRKVWPLFFFFYAQFYLPLPRFDVCSFFALEFLYAGRFPSCPRLALMVLDSFFSTLRPALVFSSVPAGCFLSPDPPLVSSFIFRDRFEFFSVEQGAGFIVPSFFACTSCLTATSVFFPSRPGVPSLPLRSLFLISFTHGPEWLA